MTDNPDAYASAMAALAVLRHLFLDLEEKGMMTPGERDQIISDALAEFVHPQETDHQVRAIAILQEFRRVLSS